MVCTANKNWIQIIKIVTQLVILFSFLYKLELETYHFYTTNKFRYTGLAKETLVPVTVTGMQSSVKKCAKHPKNADVGKVLFMFYTEVNDKIVC